MARPIIPSGRDITREGLLIVGGTIVAALVFAALPQLRDWVNRQMGRASS